MFCPECGSKNEDDALFCEKCGTSLNSLQGNGAINLVQDTTKSQHFLPCNFHSNEFPLW